MITDPRDQSDDSVGGRCASRQQLLDEIEAWQQVGGELGVIHLDLDHFHHVNTRFGQHVGDAVLLAVGERLRECSPSNGVIASVDGDAFLAFVPGADAASVRAVAERLLGVVAAPMVEGTDHIQLRATAGIAWRMDSYSGLDLVEQSFLACRRAKSTAPGTVAGYELALGDEAQRRQRVAEDLRRAISHNELRLYVQPKVDLRDGAVVGVEALVRWQHPVDGLMLPGRFLPDAEAAGLMVAIGDWVVTEAIALAMRWRTIRNGQPMRIWVNLAAQQLAKGDRLHDRVRDAITTGLIAPESIGFEVTESSLLEDLPSAVEALMLLRELGIEISLDDFGTGYSSLSYLRQLPVTAVKIDQQFVAGIGGSLADEAIIEAVIDLAHALGLRVVAEGIEAVAQAEALIRMGADRAQGYYFGRPVPPEDLEPRFGIAWCGAAAPTVVGARGDRRADELPGFGSPRARLLLAALDAAQDSIVVTAAGAGRMLDRPIVYINSAFARDYRYAPGDVVGQTIELLLPEHRESELVDWLDELHATRRAGTREMINRRSDGSLFPTEITVSPISDERGVHTHWLQIGRDLTARRAAEGDRALFEGLIEQTSALVFIAETGGQWVYANAAMRRAIGLLPDASLDGVNTRTVLPPSELTMIGEVVIPHLLGNGSWRGDCRLVHPGTGAVIEVSVDVQMFDDPLRPDVQVFAGVCRDETDSNARRCEEDRRRELGGFAAEIARQSLANDARRVLADAGSILESLGVLLRADLAFLNRIDKEQGLLTLLGEWTSDRYTQSTDMSQPLHLDRLPQWIAHLADCELSISSQTGVHESWRAEVSAVFADSPLGSDVSAPLRIGGELLGVLGVATRDASHVWSADELGCIQMVADTIAGALARERASSALRLSEERQSTLLLSVADVLAVIDPEGTIRYVNPIIESKFGHLPTEVRGRNFIELVHPDDQLLAVTSFSSTLAGELPPITELRMMCADGTFIWCDVDTSGVYHEVIGGYMVSLRDISGQRASVAATEHRAELEQVALAVSHWAVEVKSEDLVDGLANRLAELGRALNVDIAFVDLFDGDQLRSVGNWARTGAPAKSLEMPEHDASMPSLIERFRTLVPLIVEDIHTHSEPWADEWRSFPVADRAGVNVALVSEGRCIGVLGVACADEPRRWNDDEIALVQRFAEVVSALFARQAIELSLRTSEERLAALLDASLDIVVVVDQDGLITYANGAVQGALGYRSSDMVGLHVLTVVHPDDAAFTRSRLESLLADVPTSRVSVRLVGVDGFAGSWEITSGHRRDPVAGGRVLTCRNVTQELAQEAQDARSAELMALSFDVAQQALDLDSRAFLAKLENICERIGQLIDVDFVYVDQLDEVGGQLVLLGGWNREGTFATGRTVPLDGLPHWVARLRLAEPIVRFHQSDLDDSEWSTEKRRAWGEHGGLIEVAMSSAGELFGVIGVSMTSDSRHWSPDEVTFLRMIGETIAHVLERARLDDALKDSEARFRLLSEAAADLILLVSSKGFITYASPSSVAVVGYTPDELNGRNTLELVHPDDRKDGPERRRLVLARVTSTSEMRLIHKDGRTIWVVNSTSVVRQPEIPDEYQYRISLRDISDLKRLEGELEFQALHDPLTGLANRTLLASRLAIAIARRARPNDVSVLMIDLDGFKEVNDTYGHTVGDEVLRMVAVRLERLTRPTDTLARVGGDEFVLLCPETDVDGAVAIAARIIEVLHQSFTGEGFEIEFGASIGVAHRQGGDADPEALVNEADQAMYTAKHAGRGLIRVSGQTEDSAVLR